MTEGIFLMIIGMGTVFLFLVLMILAMSGSARFFQKFAHLFPEEAQQPAKATNSNNEIEEIAVAIAAVRAKR